MHGKNTAWKEDLPEDSELFQRRRYAQQAPRPEDRLSSINDASVG